MSVKADNTAMLRHLQPEGVVRMDQIFNDTEDAGGELFSFD
jgi:hypothetical protein